MPNLEWTSGPIPAGTKEENPIRLTTCPASSLEPDCTRDPRIPTQAPTGSILGSLLFTAILARTPGSRAADTISIKSCPTSGTSSLKSSTRPSSAVRQLTQ